MQHQKKETNATSEQDYCIIKFIQLQHESVAFIKSQPANERPCAQPGSVTGAKPRRRRGAAAGVVATRAARLGDKHEA